MMMIIIIIIIIITKEHVVIKGILEQQTEKCSKVHLLYLLVQLSSL